MFEMPRCGLRNIINRVSTLSNVYVDMNQTELQAVSILFSRVH